MSASREHFAVLSPLVFFSLFERALTVEEVVRWQAKTNHPPYTPAEAKVALKACPFVEEHAGYFRLRGDFTYANPHDQKVLAQRYLQKSVQYLAPLRFIPGLRSIAIANTVAFAAADAESDIDVFIVTKPGFLWWVRAIATLVLHVQGVRRHGNRVAGRFCLSFYADETAMDFRAIALPDDIYLAHWIATLIPMVGEPCYRAFLAQNQVFVHEHLTYLEPLALPFQKAGNTFLEMLLATAGAPLLWLARFVQKAKMQHLPVTLGPGADVVVNDHMLKFHNNDRRRYFRDEFHRRMQLFHTDAQ